MLPCWQPWSGWMESSSLLSPHCAAAVLLPQGALLGHWASQGAPTTPPELCCTLEILCISMNALFGTCVLCTGVVKCG